MRGVMAERPMATPGEATVQGARECASIDLHTSILPAQGRVSGGYPAGVIAPIGDQMTQQGGWQNRAVHESIIEALLASPEPAIRWKVRTRVLGEPADAVREEVRGSAIVRRLLAPFEAVPRPG